MLREEICRKIFDLGRERQRTLVYLILKQTPAEAHGSPCSYGIEIKVCETGEQARVTDLSTSRAEVYHIIDLLATSGAAPSDMGAMLSRR